MFTLSQHDQKLNRNARQGIQTAKQNYAKAQAKGDEAGMAMANAYANSIRRTYGGYTGGEDGSGYYPVMGKPEFSSRYDDKINKTQNRIINIRNFTYNPESDPVYTLYKKVYTEMGNDAYDRAMAQNSIKTGGIVNTNATASAVQAQNAYTKALADKSIDLYNAAYQRYTDSIQRQYDILDMLNNADNNDYKRYLDDVEFYKDARDFEYNVFTNELENALDNIDTKNKNKYQSMRDAEDDRKWQAEFDYKKQSDADQIAFDLLKLESDTKKWNEQAKADKYNALARLVQSVYNKSNIGVNLNALIKLLGL